MGTSCWTRRPELLVLAFFALVLGLVSFPNHALFRTYALDLGLYTHALWHYAHGTVHDSSLFLTSPQPILADHFDLYLPLFSPLIWVFGSWTLLIVQWVSTLVGAWGIWKFLLHLKVPRSLALLGMTVFLLYFGVFAAMAFDYHSNVVSTMILPWFLLALFKQQRWQGALLFFCMLIGKENMGFWLGPLVLIVAMGDLLPRTMSGFAIGVGIAGILWSIGIIGWVMPAISNDRSYAHFDYSILGNGLLDVPGALLNRPVEILGALFMDHRGTPNGTGIKIEFWWMLMLSGGWALLLKPQFGLMALPLIAQKMLHDDPGKWSVIAHYGVEFAPLIAIAGPLALMRYSPGRFAKILPWVAVIFSVVTTIRLMDRTIAYHDRSRIRIYQAQHYVKPYDVEQVKDVLRSIPANASVSAQSPAVPHLALRDHVYQYPIVADAEYILLLPQESPYPLDTTQYHTMLKSLLEDPLWNPVQVSDAAILLHKPAP